MSINREQRSLRRAFFLVLCVALVTAAHAGVAHAATAQDARSVSVLAPGASSAFAPVSCAAARAVSALVAIASATPQHARRSARLSERCSTVLIMRNLPENEHFPPAGHAGG